MYRFLMATLLGPVNNGILGTTMSVQGIFQTLASGGLPPAISKYIAEYEAVEDHNMARQTIYTALKIMVFLGLKDLYLPVLIAGLIADLFVYVFTYPRYHADEVMTAFFGIAYVAVCLSSIFQIRNLPGGEFTVWLVFLCSWGSDTFAYCAGRLFGRHKMAPELSPKKTVEGAVGGVLGSAAAGMIYAACMIHFMHAENVRIPVYGLICVCGALISMVGDLAASAIKRNHDIKDYGRLIPGHGGILDRFDSVIAAAPGILLLALIFG